MTPRFKSVLREDRAQDGFEYLLAAGIVAVALAVGLFAFSEIIPDFVGHACPSVDTAAVPPPTDGSCVIEAP